MIKLKTKKISKEGYDKKLKIKRMRIKIEISTINKVNL
jgi:hypothetical protein